MLILLIGCTQDIEETQLAVKQSNKATMDKDVAREFLMQTLESYKEVPFEELANDVGIGDSFYVVAKGNDGSEEGYSVSIDIEWSPMTKSSLVLTATVFGPGPEGGGVLPELQRESIVIEGP